MKLGNKHAKEFGYSRYVGEEVEVTGRKKEELVEVKMKVKDVPFPVTILVHPEDVTYG